MATERAGEVVSITSLDRISPKPELAPTVPGLLNTRDPKASPWLNAPVWETYSALLTPSTARSFLAGAPPL